MRFLVLVFAMCGCSAAMPGPDGGPPLQNDGGAAAGALSNGLVRYRFDPSTGALTHVETASWSLVNAEPALWQLSVTDAEGHASTVRPPAQASVTVSSDLATLTWQTPEGLTVTVTARLAPGAPRALWTVQVDNPTALHLVGVDFPRVASPGAASMYYLVPLFGGAVIPTTLARPQDVERFVYPGMLSAQVTALVDPAQHHGLYLAALDGDARIKRFGYQTSAEGSAALSVIDFPDALDTAGNDFASPYSIELGPFEGDWYDAAQLYRGWAVQQKWSLPPFSQRPAASGAWSRSARLLLAPVNPDATDFSPGITSLALEYGAQTGARAGEIAVSPFLWNAGPYTEGDLFPARPGFADETRRLVDAGVPMVPYTNARVAVRDVPGWTQALADATARKPDGSPWLETYHGAPMAVLCPATTTAQQRHRDITTTLRSLAPVSGLHLDQLGAANPVLCFDGAHGHPPAGRFWADGVRALARGVLEAGGPAFATTTEDPSEVLNDVVALHTNHYGLGAVVRKELPGSTPVPLLTALYHDRTGYLLSHTVVPATLRQLDYDVGHAYGYVIGNRLSVIDTSSSGAFDLHFLATLLRSYDVTGPYLLEGQLLRTPTIDSDGLTVQLPDPYEPTQMVSLDVPRIEGSLWLAADGTAGLVLVNPSGEAASVPLSLSKQALGLPASVRTVRRVLPDEVVLGSFDGGDRVEWSQPLAPRSLVFVRLEP